MTQINVVDLRHLPCSKHECAELIALVHIPRAGLDAARHICAQRLNLMQALVDAGLHHVSDADQPE